MKNINKVVCKYYDKELNCCKYLSDWSTAMPVLQPCVENPCKYYTMSEQAELTALRKFKAYFDGLYGIGLEVSNWHENGMTEPFDNFYDSAIEEYYHEIMEEK